MLEPTSSPEKTEVQGLSFPCRFEWTLQNEDYSNNDIDFEIGMFSYGPEKEKQTTIHLLC